jgi:hypothetical protein
VPLSATKPDYFRTETFQSDFCSNRGSQTLKVNKLRLQKTTSSALKCCVKKNHDDKKEKRRYFNSTGIFVVFFTTTQLHVMCRCDDFVTDERKENV